MYHPTKVIEVHSLRKKDLRVLKAIEVHNLLIRVKKVHKEVEGVKPHKDQQDRQVPIEVRLVIEDNKENNLLIKVKKVHRDHRGTKPLQDQRVHKVQPMTLKVIKG